MSFTTSDFIPLSPVTLNPYFEANVPHMVVIINGTSYLPLSYRITEKVHGAADDATILLSISNNPDFTLEFYQADSSSDGSALPVIPIFVEIWAGFRDTPAPTTDRSGLTQRFSGILDSYSASPDSNEITFTCRSLAAPFIDQKLTSVAMNQTSVQFVQAMAKTIGLQTNIALAAGVVPITVQEALGRPLTGLTTQNYNAAIQNKHPWDLMLQMALFDDVDVWVSGNTLNYIAPSKVDRTTVNLVYGGDGKSTGPLRPVGTHSTTQNRNIRVEVRSHVRHSKQSTLYRVDSADGGVIVSSIAVTLGPNFDPNQNAATQSYFLSLTTGKETPLASSSDDASNSQPGYDSSKILYKRSVSSLTPQRCKQLALSLWRQHSMHEFSLSFDLPMSKALLNDFSITSLLKITGLPYDLFNTHNASDAYYPREIVESFDLTNGWTRSVHAVNSVLPPGSP